MTRTASAPVAVIAVATPRLNVLPAMTVARELSRLNGPPLVVSDAPPLVIAIAASANANSANSRGRAGDDRLAALHRARVITATTRATIMATRFRVRP